MWQCRVSCPQSRADAMVCVQHCDLAQQTHPDGEWPFKIQEFHNLLSWLCASTVRRGAASTSRGWCVKEWGGAIIWSISAPNSRIMLQREGLAGAPAIKFPDVFGLAWYLLNITCLMCCSVQKTLEVGFYSPVKLSFQESLSSEVSQGS